MNPRVSLTVPPLPPETYQKYRGKWIALSGDRSRIIASADDLAALEDQLAAVGVHPETVALDCVEADDACLGGAELL
jgi:hypothetical protein